MARIVFFEKKGCINNTKQKELLSLAGHNVEARDLIVHPWCASELLRFFDGMSVKDWFNPNAPDVCEGRIRPEAFTREEALSALLDNHLLIKRPLMVIEGQHIVGFDKEFLERRIGLSQKPTEQLQNLLQENLNDCPQKAAAATCDEPSTR